MTTAVNIIDARVKNLFSGIIVIVYFNVMFIFFLFCTMVINLITAICYMGFWYITVAWRYEHP